MQARIFFIKNFRVVILLSSFGFSVTHTRSHICSIFSVSSISPLYAFFRASPKVVMFVGTLLLDDQCAQQMARSGVVESLIELLKAKQEDDEFVLQVKRGSKSLRMKKYEFVREERVEEKAVQSKEQYQLIQKQNVDK